MNGNRCFSTETVDCNNCVNEFVLNILELARRGLRSPLEIACFTFNCSLAVTVFRFDAK